MDIGGRSIPGRENIKCKELGVGCAWSMCGLARRPGWLEQSERGKGRRKGGQIGNKGGHFI